MPLKFGTSAEAMIGIDEQGLIVYWNDEAAKLLGREASEVIGRPCEVLQGRKPAGGHLCGPNCPIRADCRNLHAPRRFDMVVRHPNGTQLWLEVTTLIVLDDDRPISLHLLAESVAVRQLSDIAETVVRRISHVEPASVDFMLTRRERDVLALLADGLRTTQIAGRLRLAEPTIRNHVQSLLGKLGAHSRAEAIIFGVKHGLVHLH